MVTALRARVSMRTYGVRAARPNISSACGRCFASSLRQFAIDRLVGHRKDVAGQLDIVEGRAAQPQQPRHQRLRRIVGRAGKRAEAGDEDAKLFAHRSISAICSAASAGVMRPSATSASIFFTLARIDAIGAQPRHHPLLQHRPHPFHLLLAPPRGEFAGRIHRGAVIENLLPQLVDAGAGQRRIGQDRRMPVLRARG